MKQHITPKQLNELSEKGKEKYRKAFCPEFKDVDVAALAGKLLSIGQMLEFLDKHHTFKFKNYYKWTDCLLFEDGINGAVFYEVKKWCDKLWEPVKEILNG